MMEFVAYYSHKYLMHGLLKHWHVDHHVHDRKRIDTDEKHKGFEKNDLFFLVFAIPAMLIMISGIVFQISPLIFLSVGITLYGLTYFIVHDLMYHQRLSLPFLKRIKGKYFKAVMRAHRAHHKPNSKGDFECYGLLLFPKRFFKA